MLALSRNLGNGVPQMEFLKKYASNMLAQPSSAPIERVFSMLQTVIADQQGSALSDMQAGSMMTYYNSRERARP